ncbi:MAG: Gfo/Idh/MocA family oxidoreductase [Phycisphaeraceae bacterium]
MKIGICGAGRFARCFIPLFKAHPLVDEVVLADLLPERAAEYAQHNGIRRVMGSLDELCRSDVDAIAIFTQRQLHGPQAIQALDAGKHVYSAVPAAIRLDDLATLVQTVERTGLLYMTGETSYYYPSTLYCRKRFRAGDFGRFAYAQAQYLHDMDHFYNSYKHSGGPDWKRVAGLPPMYYPTHTMSMVLSVTGAKATQVSCLGMVDDHEDEVFRVGSNDYDNVFSNESALLRTNDGGVMRINEMRRVGWSGGNSVYMSFFGTDASFEENAMSTCWATKDRAQLRDLTKELTCANLADPEGLVRSGQTGDEFFTSVCTVHPIERLPASYRGLTNGHYGSHQFLVDDFVTAWATQVLPPCHVWNSAAWCAPGLVAHESARQEGTMLSIPDYGNPPAGSRQADQPLAAAPAPVVAGAGVGRA